MSNDPETTRIVRSWLDEGVTRLPDRVLDAVLDEVPATPQRRATWWPVRRYQSMNGMLKYGLAAAVVVIAILLGMNYFGTNVGGSPDPTPIPSPTPVGALNGQQPLTPGRYAIEDGTSARVSAEVPSGWHAVASWAMRPPTGHEPPEGSGIRFYTVGNLFNDPGSFAGGLQDPPVGPTVDDLVDAIVAQEEWTSSTLDGYDHWRLRGEARRGHHSGRCGPRSTGRRLPSSCSRMRAPARSGGWPPVRHSTSTWWTSTVSAW